MKVSEVNNKDLMLVSNVSQPIVDLTPVVIDEVGELPPKPMVDGLMDETFDEIQNEFQ